MGPKKLSGAKYRKMKKETEEDNKKLANQWEKWVKKCDSNNNSSGSRNSEGEAVQDQHLDTDLIDAPEQVETNEDVASNNFTNSRESNSRSASKKPAADDIITEAEEVEPDTLAHENSANCSENEKNEELNLNDPSSWPVIDSQLRTYLIERGPLQGKDADFSLSENLIDKRRFSVDWFKKFLSNGETVERAWMIYTIVKIIYRGKRLEKHLKENKTIDDRLEEAIQNEKQRWRHILKIVTDCVIFCGTNNLAFRGSSNQIGDPKCGIFLGLIELISHYDATIAKHIAESERTTYLSNKIQNELIDILSTKKDQYVVEESFIDFIKTSKKTGHDLAIEIQQKLIDDDLDIGNCRGQAYDNGANMAGKYQGVQAHIQKSNELARFLPCTAHSLNLLGVHAARVSIKMCFGIRSYTSCIERTSFYKVQIYRLMKVVELYLD
ncbi:uncharacterized protein LOC124416209 [Diprion similis]|uniref:uncharacterized protein LOC124416209 n=1 Tax=Diprion similis TaxID=362088 RepID=UPI001EF98417|nr:uncharacterized protein LOC124416209 [Diprion similis]